ncbi:MAG: S-layer homology domain-containing protein [Thermoleophilia bacterium]
MKRIVAWIAFALLVVSVVMFGPVGPALALPPGWNALSVDLVGSNPSAAMMDDGRIVWVATVGSGPEVFLLDVATGTTTQLSEDGYKKSLPSIKGDYVAWRTEVKPGIVYGSEVSLHRISTGDTKVIARDVRYYVRPGLSEDLVVWAGLSGPSRAGLFGYDLKTGATFLIADSVLMFLGEEGGPFVDGRYVVWNQGEGTSTTVSLYDHQTKHSTPIVGGAGFKYRATVGAGYVLWDRSDGQRSQIALHRPGSTQPEQVTNGNFDSRLEFSASGGVVDGQWAVWTGEPQGSGSQVYLYNLQDGTTRTITGGVVESGSRPTVADGRVAMEGRAVGSHSWGPGGDIFVYDPAASRTLRLTAGEQASLYQIQGDSVLWGSTNPASGQPTLILASGPIGSASFVDVTQGSSHYDAIQELADWGIIGGYETPTGRQFRPEQPVKRAQFAKMICGSIEQQATEDMQIPFSDLGPDDPDNLYPHEWVALAAQLHITVGVKPGQFAPYADISRAQVVTMVVRAGGSGVLDVPDPAFFVPTLGNFSEQHAVPMLIAEYNGLLQGLQGFGPGWDPWAPATRAEVAQILSNLRAKLAGPGVYW